MKSEVPQQPAFRQADVIASFVLSRVKSVWSKVSGRKVEKSEAYDKNSPRKIVGLLPATENSPEIVLCGGKFPDAELNALKDLYLRGQHKKFELG